MEDPVIARILFASDRQIQSPCTCLSSTQLTLLPRHCTCNGTISTCLSSIDPSGFRTGIHTILLSESLSVSLSVRTAGRRIYSPAWSPELLDTRGGGPGPSSELLSPRGGGKSRQIDAIPQRSNISRQIVLREVIFSLSLHWSYLFSNLWSLQWFTQRRASVAVTAYCLNSSVVIAFSKKPLGGEPQDATLNE